MEMVLKLALLLAENGEQKTGETNEDGFAMISPVKDSIRKLKTAAAASFGPILALSPEKFA